MTMSVIQKRKSFDWKLDNENMSNQVDTVRVAVAALCFFFAPVIALARLLARLVAVGRSVWVTRLSHSW